MHNGGTLLQIVTPRQQLRRLMRGIRETIFAPAALALGLWAAPAGAVDLFEAAARYENTNPARRAHNWCAEFMNMVLRKVGIQGTNSAIAGSFLALPRASGPAHGAIVILGRHGVATHVAIVDRIDRDGLHIISGNWSHRVARGVVSPSTVLAYVEPGRMMAQAPAQRAITAAIRPHRHWLHHRKFQHSHVRRRASAHGPNWYRPRPASMPVTYRRLRYGRSG